MAGVRLVSIQGGRFRSDAAWSAAGTALPVLVGALTVPLLLRNLSPGDFSVFALCLAVISFAPSFDLGISRTALRRVAALETASIDERGEFARRCVYRAWLTGCGIGVVMAVAAYLLTREGAPGAGRWHEATGPLCVAALGVPLAVAGNTQRAVLEARRMFATSASVRIGLGLLTPLAPLLLTLWTTRLEWLCLSLVLLRLVVVLHQHRVMRASGLWAPRLPLIKSVSAAGFWSESLWYALLTPLALAMSGFDRFLIAWIGNVDAEELAVLLAPQEIALRAIILPAALIPALLVRLAAPSTPDTVVATLSGRLAVSVGPAVFLACALACVVAPWVVASLFVGLDAAAVTNVAQVLAVGVFSNAIAQMPMAQLTARGLVRDVAWMQAVQFPLYLLALGPLVAHWGMLGAAWAWSGRICIDTAMLIACARYRLPTLRIAGIQTWHLAGLVLLAGLGAWI